MSVLCFIKGLEMGECRRNGDVGGYEGFALNVGVLSFSICVRVRDGCEGETVLNVAFDVDVCGFSSSCPE